jgi:hypothetical protein
MPNRIIRGDLLDSDRYNSLTHDSERLLFVELLLLADDYGLVPVNFGFLRRRTTPCVAKSMEQVTQMVSALADADLIRCYQSDRGGQFAFIPRFDNRPQALKPKWPIPPANVTEGAIELAQANSKGLYRKQAHSANATATRSYVAPETETETEIQKKKIRAPRAASLPSAAPSGVSPEVWNDFKTLRAKHKAPITPTAMAGIEREAAKAGLSLEDALRTCCERSWRGFKADWLVDTSGNGKTLLGRSGKPEEPSRYARPGLIGKMKELERRALEAKETER